MINIFGLTGGIGSGKSTVASAFRQYSINIVDADTAARDVVALDSPALASIASYFGDAILHADGTLNRTKLRQIIFADAGKKQWLEQLLHPLIRQRITLQLEQSPSIYTLLESPLLLETDQHKLVDKVIVVDVEESTQLARASLRDGASTEQIQRIIASQLSREQRCSRADFIINNDGPLTETLAQVDALHQTLLGLAQA